MNQVKWLNRCAFITMISFFILHPSSHLLAQPPSLINYQGRLVDGTNLVNGNVALSLRLYDDAVAGALLYEDSNTVTVVDGLYSTFLGDDTVSGSLTVALTNAGIWIESVVNGVALLPRERVASVAYALMSGGVRDGGVTAPMLASGAASSNLQAGGQSAVPGGGIILSQDENDTNLIASGYTLIGTANLALNEWFQGETNGAPSPRAGSAFAWTGTELLIWGGYDGTNYPLNGARYNPETKVWTAMSTTGAPSARVQATTVWSGTELIIWGGFDLISNAYFTDGARYNPITDTWTAMSTTGAPSPRTQFTAVWSGTEMIVWGGQSNTLLNTGGRYHPGSNTWTAMSTVGAPSARQSHTAVWANNEMIVWGGFTNPGITANTGARYHPGSNTWTAMTLANAPTGRFGHAALWTGNSMLIWGGNRTNQLLSSGSIYTSSPESWTTMSTINAPAGRMYPLAVWSGTEMLMWGGFVFGSVIADGAIWSNNAWRLMSTFGEPAARYSHSGVWTGNNLLFFGGVTETLLNQVNGDVWSYVTSPEFHLYQR